MQEGMIFYLQSLYPDSKWISLLFVSVVSPFFYSLLSSHLTRFLQKLHDWLFNTIDMNDYVYVQNLHNLHTGLYRYVETFLDSKAEAETSCKKVTSYPACDDSLRFTLYPSQRVADTFQGAQVEWECCEEKKSNDYTEVMFKLKTRKEDRRIQRPYLLHIVRTVQDMESKQQERYLYSYKATNSHWESTIFRHPACFDTLALDPGLKEQIMRDLRAFSNGKEYYQRVGKPWKRGYLLYGPPGTGKSTMIAAIANYMNYDIFDLDLSDLSTNTQLREVLVQTHNKSVIVIEDIDCCFSKSLQSRTESESRITLSGMLNFADGLWSGCSDERIFVFTTNYIDKLDPALLRKGRMDLDIEDHELLPEIGELLQVVNITPAEIAEALLEMRNEPTAALESTISQIKAKCDQPEPAHVEGRRSSRIPVQGQSPGQGGGRRNPTPAAARQQAIHAAKRHPPMNSHRSANYFEEDSSNVTCP